ncbi:hypothetical protein MPSEU_000572200 [Mayamaea pseudoterrestris]|nr:hypothetical protein MPSEU_000572200 [Mayamaea pseudoterrestris]
MAGPRKVLHVAGYDSCGFFTRAVSVLRSVAILFPHRIKVIPHTFEDRATYRAWLLGDDGFRTCFTDPLAQTHSTSPMCWFTKSESDGLVKDEIHSFLGGHDDTLDWCRTFLAPSDKEKEVTATMVDDGHAPNHNYDYDFVVIGGGSGGMAASKEAAALGAKVACLDFVRPSPHGTTWGLGGTCVNVGCIPKKLLHAGALLRESIHADMPGYGIMFGAETGGDHDGNNEIKTRVAWSIVRENIQNYIRGLNFKYRVRLREKNVTYLNKLAKFIDPHTIEATDRKGQTTTITSSRFLIATGGRPSPLECEGGELAISSDDVFSLEESPGKTLCVGASYISLECAGFLAGLGLDVTVAVRSILLRGFDRECADRIDTYMSNHGVKFKREVTVLKLEKEADGLIKATLSDGSIDTYNTVLVAVGRTADTAKLGLENTGVVTNPKNRKVVGKLEQSSCPNIYAVGDVLDNTPELTPVAIQAGVALARRLFGGSKEPMDYVNICTTVFTPIEYACVGISEEDAIAQFGESNIEVYHREFQPLEWSLSASRSHNTAFCKAVVDKTPDEKVLGIHYVGPNAGEVMQGFGAAMKNGLSYKTLVDTVGIHPTSAEEIVTLAITKSGGEDAAAGGC